VRQKSKLQEFLRDDCCITFLNWEWKLSVYLCVPMTPFHLTRHIHENVLFFLGGGRTGLTSEGECIRFALNKEIVGISAFQRGWAPAHEPWHFCTWMNLLLHSRLDINYSFLFQIFAILSKLRCPFLKRPLEYFNLILR